MILRKLLAFLMTITTFVVSAQEPNLDSWQVNTDGTLASFWEETSTDTYELTELSDLADVQSVCYTNDSIWISTEGLTTRMGFYQNPGTPGAQGVIYRMPRVATEETSTKTETPTTFSIGVLINGISIFGNGDATSYDQSAGTNQANGAGIWNGDAWYSEGFTLDSAYGAHPNGDGGTYHTHATPFFLYEDSVGHSPIIGYSFDGYPIYGPYGYSDSLNSSSSVVRMETSYQLRSITQRHTLPDGTILSPGQYGPDVDGSFPLGTYIEDYEYVNALGHLDEHNGRWCVTPEFPGGTYAYFVTIDAAEEPAFPYYIGASYYGVVDQENFANGSIGSIDGSATCIEGVLALSGDLENIDPDSAEVGTSSVTITFSFADDVDPATPPNNIAPDAVTLGGVSGTSISRDNTSGDVTATFDISALSEGTYDLVATFSPPMGSDIDYISEDAFTMYETSSGGGDEIINVSPASSTALSSVTVSFDIDTSATPNSDPPYGVAPDAVTLGGISGTSISRDGTSGTITVTFDLSSLSDGTYDIEATFNPPMGAAIVNSTADVFTITSGGIGSTGEANLTEWWYNKYGSTITIASTGETIITDVEHVHYDDDNIYITSSGVPNYYSDETFFTASDQDWTYFIPKDPVEESGSKTSVSVFIGLFVDGTAALSPGDGQSYNNDDIWNQLAYEFEGNDFDASNGHSTAANIYHHHVANKALYDFDGSAHSPIIGFAFDGFPIYGPFGYSDSLDAGSGISRMEPSYQKRNITDRTTLADGTVLSPAQYGPDLGTEELGKYEEDYEFISNSGSLDYYNGRYCVTPEYPSGTYAYFITVDAANDPVYPYIAGLEFYGDVATQNFGPSGGETTIPGTAVEYIEIIQDPSDYAGTEGNTAYFKADCNGTPSTVVWQESTDNGTTWNNLSDDAIYSGTATDSLGISNVSSGMFSNLYRLYITGDNSIDSSASAELTGGSGITVIASASPSTSICIGESVTLSATGAVNYFWNQGLGLGDTHVVSPTVTTTYTVSGDDGAGNADTDVITIIVNDLPTVSAGSDQTICSGTSVTLSGSGAASYSWDNSVTDGVSFAPTTTTTYTVTGTDANGCVNTDDVVVTVNDLPTVNAGSDQTVCSGSSVTLSGSGAVSYSWDNSVTDGVSFAPTTTTTYTVTGTDANGCVNTDDVIVTVNDLPTVSGGSDQTVCSGSSVTLSGSGAASYTWDNSVTNGVSFTPIATTTYTVTGTDANGCVNTDDVVVTVNDLPTVSAGSDQTICTGSSVTLSGSGAATYSWDNSVTDGASFTPIATATYTVTGTDANGCVNTDDVIVTVNDLPTVGAGSDQTVCEGTSVTLSGSGAATYSWDNSVSNGVSFTPTSTTTYTVTGTDANGCINTDDVTITIDAMPTANAGVDQSVCADNAVLGASTPTIGSGVWSVVSGSGSVTTPSSATSTVTGLVDGTTLDLLWTVSNGVCPDATDDVSISRTSSAPVSVTITPNDPSLCLGEGQTFTANPVNGGTNPQYEWFLNSASQGVGTSSTFSIITAVDGDEVEVILTSDLGCATGNPATSATSTVTVNPLPAVSAGTDQTVCSGTSVTLSGSGAVSYNWDNSVTDGVSFTPTVTTTYTVTGTDANGCVNTDDVIVTVNDLPTVSAGSDQAVCSGSSVTLSGSGAATYSWDNSVTDGVSFAPSATATYTVTGTDVNGCVNTDDVIVTVNDLPTVNAGSDQTVCTNDMVTLSGSGASTYSWDNSVNDGIAFSATATTTYTVTGTDVNGCVNTDDVTITVQSSVTPSVTIGGSDVCDGSNMIVTVSDSLGGGNNPSFAWTIDGNPVGGDQNNIMVPAASGGEVVQVTMTSNLSCVTTSTASDQLTTTVHALPTVDAGIDQTVCNGTDVTLSGSGATTYTWDNGVSDGVAFTATSTTTYTVVGTDANGCSNSDDVIITVDPCTGVADVHGINIGLYPNPTSGLITITGIDGAYELVLLNELGLSLSTWSGVSTNDVQINLSDFSSGVYFIQVIQNGELNILRVILE